MDSISFDFLTFWHLSCFVYIFLNISYAQEVLYNFNSITLCDQSVNTVSISVIYGSVVLN